MNKFFTAFKIGIFISLSASVFLAGFLVMPNSTYADGCSTNVIQPTFNPYTVTWGNTAGCINGVNTDFAVLSGGVHGSGVWAPSFNAQVGDSITLMVYVHNGAASGSGAVMHNVKYDTVENDSSDGASHTFTTTLTADNATNSGKQGSVTVSTPAGSTLQLTSGNLGGTIGEMQPCFEFAQIFYITFKVVGSTLAPAPTASLSATPSGPIMASTTINYTWSSTNAVSATSYYTIDTADTCGNVPGVQHPWVATTTAGTFQATIFPCQAGHTYTITYTVTGSSGQTAFTQIVVPVIAPTTPPPETTPTATLTANKSHDITIKAGDPVTYDWSSANATNSSGNLQIYLTSTHTAVAKDACGDFNISGPVSTFSGLSGTLANQPSKNCETGYTYVFTYTVTDANGKSASDSASVTVIAPVVPPTFTASLTINNATTGGFIVGDHWGLKLLTNIASTAFSICGTHIPGVTNVTCAPWGVTDANGNWTQTGNFSTADIGAWTEYMEFPSQNNFSSNQISFTVSAPSCLLPQITSSLSASATVGTAFSYTLTASSTQAVILSVATSTLPSWLSFNETTKILSGIPTTSGVFDITLNAKNSCGLDTQTLVLTISPYACPLNDCGGGKPPIINTPPIITLIGANPATVIIGTSWIDPGATATDLEDGNLTSKIISTGAINTNVLGTYNVFYSVTDSGGLTATTTRVVNVVSSNPNPNPPSTVSFNIVASKIVCNSASDLPKWGTGGPYITATTASTFLSSHPNCHLEPNWKFQWGLYTLTDPGSSFIGEAAGWNTFGPTDSSGSATTTITVSSTDPSVWVREVLQSGYIPFSYPSNTFPSAGMYCHTDVLNYDNYDRVTSPTSGGTYYCVSFNAPSSPVNTPPVITLIGANPATTTVGTSWIDPGATATDLEDGNLTSKIISTSTVNINIPGTYSVLYSVTDSGGLTATTTRAVDVVNPNPTQTGQITFCMLFGDQNNNLATTSVGLPIGTFAINLGTSTNFTSATIYSHIWDSQSFNPSQKTILGVNDSDCVTVPNLSFGVYHYSPIIQTGSLWNTPKYSDQETQPVNSVFDLFSYSTSTNSNPNADGEINLSSARTSRTLVLYDTYNPAPACLIPQITSSLSASATVGTAFSYTLTASSTQPVTLSVATSTLPSWLSFATTTNTLSGTPTDQGTWNITLNAKNSCGLATQILVLTVSPSVCTSDCGGASSDLKVSKTVDKTTANTGDTITYTVTISNSGPNDATGVNVTDMLPSGLTFVSATSTLGSYATTTGIWTIGNLANASSTTLTMVATINNNTTGQTITNTAVGKSDLPDPNPSDDTTSVNVSVNVPPYVCTSNCGGGGGGGGGGGNGPIVQNSLTIYNEQVVQTVPGIAMVTWNTNLLANRRVVYGNASNQTLTADPNYGYPNSTDLVKTPLLTAHGMVVAIDPTKTYYFRPISSDGTSTVTGKELILSPTATTTSGTCYYLYDYLRKDLNNNPVEVKKLQIFLNSFEGDHLTVNGVYDDATIVAVDAFQAKYSNDILTPWGYGQPTDYTYILTKKKVNEIYCQMAFPVTPQQQTEIDATKAFFESLQNQGITPANIGNQPIPATTTPLLNNVVGEVTGGKTTNLSTLAGVSSTTQSFASRMTANVIGSGKTLGNLIVAFFTWPFGNIMKNVGVNWCTNGFSGGWFSWLLLLIILIILVLWYRQYHNNKKIEKINKEIDLE